MSAKVQGVYNCATLAQLSSDFNLQTINFLNIPEKSSASASQRHTSPCLETRHATCHLPLGSSVFRHSCLTEVRTHECEADGGQSFNPVEKCTHWKGGEGEKGEREAVLVANQSCTLPIGCHCVLPVYDCDYDYDSDSNFDSQSKLINFWTHSIDSPALLWPTGWAIRKTLLLTLHIQQTHCNLSLFALLLAGLVPESSRQMAKTWEVYESGQGRLPAARPR